VSFSIRFNEEKNQLLKATRGVCFDDVIFAIKSSRLLDNVAHPNYKRSNQKVYIVEINAYAYAVPHVVNKQKKEIYLKTIYPSRKFTKKYLEGVR